MRAMKQIDFYVPVNLKGSVLARADDLQYVKHLVASRFGGCTLHPWLEGIWVNAEGKPVYDSIMIVAVVTPNRDGLYTEATNLADLICVRFNQECLFVTLRDVLTIDQPNAELYASALANADVLAH